MEHLEKTVFISYRRVNIPWALAISPNLTQHGYDVFFDFNGLASGDFEHVIIENIKARAHFLALLTPSALERCSDPKDLLRLEIEAALRTRRNIVPLMLEGFDFSSPRIASQLVGPLIALKKYNAVRVPSDYFDAAMERIRQKWLTVALSAVAHPASEPAVAVAKSQQEDIARTPPVSSEELTSQEWYERAVYASDAREKVELYTQAIRLSPDFAAALFSRGTARKASGDLRGAHEDYNAAINIDPGYAKAFYAG